MYSKNVNRSLIILFYVVALLLKLLYVGFG